MGTFGIVLIIRVMQDLHHQPYLWLKGLGGDRVRFRSSARFEAFQASGERGGGKGPSDSN